MGERKGYRGYMSTRPVRGTVIPQRVQNLVIRDYAARNGLPYLMNVSEFAMPGSFMILEHALAELDRIEGIIAFSAFMFPAERERRLEIYGRILGHGASLHAALENLAVRSHGDIGPFEDLIETASALERAPFGGRYEKAERSLVDTDDPFVLALGL